MTFFLSQRLKHSDSELKKKKADLKTTEKGYEKDAAVAEKLKNEQDKIEVGKLQNFTLNLIWYVLCSSSLVLQP